MGCPTLFTRLRCAFDAQTCPLLYATSGSHAREATDDQSFSLREIRQVYRVLLQKCQCSGCGFVREEIAPDERAWTCPVCGRCHDRDSNAAQSFLAEGLQLSAEGLSVAACGGRVRPNLNNKEARARPDETGTSAGDGGEIPRLPVVERMSTWEEACCQMVALFLL